MKVIVIVEITVDPRKVETEYGEKQSADEIREWLNSETVAATESAVGHVVDNVTSKRYKMRG